MLELFRQALPKLLARAVIVIVVLRLSNIRIQRVRRDAALLVWLAEKVPPPQAKPANDTRPRYQRTARRSSPAGIANWRSGNVARDPPQRRNLIE